MDNLTAQAKMVKAGKQYHDEDGVVYTVLSNRKVCPPHLRGHAEYQVSAYTFDLSVWSANGKLDGRKCHFADTLTPSQFLRLFTKI